MLTGEEATWEGNTNPCRRSRDDARLLI